MPVPSARGSWPCTVTLVCTPMPRLRNERRTTLATSVSHPARMLPSASSTVTSTPRSPIIEANSQPMAPPPMTTADAGSRSRKNSSSEVTTMRPSTSKPPIVRGADPVARMIDGADTAIGEPPPSGTTSTSEGPADRAGAGVDGHLALAQEPGKARGELIDDPLLATQHRRPVDSRLRSGHAELGCSGHGAIHRGCLEQLLGRDAANVQARSPHFVVLHDRHIETGARAVQGPRRSRPGPPPMTITSWVASLTEPPGSSCDPTGT